MFTVGAVDLDAIVLVADGPAVSCRAVTDGLVIVIGRVIRVVPDKLAVTFEFGAGRFRTLEARVDFSVIVVVERGVGSMVLILAERVVVWPDVVGVERLSTTTGRVMRVVLDELMVRFELVVGGLYVLEVEGLLTLTDPGVVLGPMVILRFVDEEFDDFGVGEVGREVPELLEGARLGADIVGARLEFVPDGARLGAVADGVRLGVLTFGDRLGAAGLRVLLPDDALGAVPPADREVDPGALLDALRVEAGEVVGVDGVLAAGVGVAALDETPATCL
ncbi:MAG TPA: hypothetical protein VJJ98_14350 [Sedimentisphaerales bacterium]|nr:hypothetical protein [Sedimentisphaerales bacterium]